MRLLCVLITVIALFLEGDPNVTCQNYFNSITAPPPVCWHPTISNFWETPRLTSYFRLISSRRWIGSHYYSAFLVLWHTFNSFWQSFKFGCWNETCRIDVTPEKAFNIPGPPSFTVIHCLSCSRSPILSLHLSVTMTSRAGRLGFTNFKFSNLAADWVGGKRKNNPFGPCSA